MKRSSTKSLSWSSTLELCLTSVTPFLLASELIELFEVTVEAKVGMTRLNFPSKYCLMWLKLSPAQVYMMWVFSLRKGLISSMISLNWGVSTEIRIFWHCVATSLLSEVMFRFSSGYSSIKLSNLLRCLFETINSSSSNSKLSFSMLFTIIEPIFPYPITPIFIVSLSLCVFLTMIMNFFVRNYAYYGF